MSESQIASSLAGFNADFARLISRTGGLDTEILNLPATISDVEDPENLGRVRVLFGEDSVDAKSDWIPVLGVGRGILSTQYIGSKCIVIAISGSPDNSVVAGLFNDTTYNQVISQTPITIPTIDVSDITNTEDPGAKCNKNNEGRAYIFSGNVTQDLKVCIRRNNRQTGPDKDVWEWKNLTRGLIIERETDPKTAKGSDVVHQKRPQPTCSEALSGEMIEYSEDRDLPQKTLVCRRDENKDWAWVSASTLPWNARGTLPKCTEKIHGMTSIADDGGNSEMTICLRVDRKMKWVKYGTRTALKFEDKDPVMSKTEILGRGKSPVKPNTLLNLGLEFASAAVTSPIIGNMDLAGGMVEQALSGAVPGFTNEAIAQAFNAVEGLATGQLPVDLATQVAAGFLQSQDLNISGLDAILRSGDVATAQNFLDKLGPEIAQIVSAGGNLGGILQKTGSSATNQSISSFPPQVGSIINATLVDGPLGGLNAAVANASDIIPFPVNEAVKFAISGLDLGNAPAPLNAILQSATNGGLSEVVNSIAGGIDFGGVDLEGLTSAIGSGSFGEVGKLFQDFSNIGTFASLVPGLPTTASSLLGAAGLGGPLALALPGGLGFTAVTALLGGKNPLASILGGGGALGALGGLFGGGGGDPCPCSPKCRKTEHGVDSDGNRLLDPCGNVTLDNSNVYLAGNDILNNLDNPLAKALGLVSTGIGGALIPKNPFNLTSIIESVDRVNDLSGKLEAAFKGGAEGEDRDAEIIYSMEAIEKVFKVADNNMSLMELIQNLELLGSKNFMDNLITGGKGALLTNVTTDSATQAQAIRDLYKMVLKLDKKKDGIRGLATITPALAKTFTHTKTIPAYYKKSRTKAILNLIKTILEALKILETLDPKLDAPFSDLTTRNNESKVLNDSLSAKLNLNQPEEDTVNYIYQDFTSKTGGIINSLSTNQLNSGEFDSLLQQINNEQERARKGEGDCS